MATNFPTSLDTFTDPTSTTNLATLSHAGQHTAENDAIAALEAKVGINGSAVTSSLDYKIAHLTSAYAPQSTFPGLSTFAILERTACGGTPAPGAGLTTMHGFTAPLGGTFGHITAITVIAGSAAHCTLALYSLDASGNATQIATTGDITSTLNAVGVHTVAFTASASITAGNAYAAGVYFDTGSPNLVGSTGSYSFRLCAHPVSPYLAGTVSGAPPSSITFASLSFTSNLPVVYLELSA